uniref:Uncharacterized protein n=1 Tax=Clytia hemisphaerica TaxID=252671 RepID=A0A7M5XKB2_9CNID
MKSYFASVTAYDINQVTIAKSYHSRCKKCKRTFSYGFIDEKSGMRKLNVDRDYIMFNNVTAYSKRLMKYIDNMITIGAVSFEKLSEIVEGNWESNKINPDRIEEAWFIYRILEFMNVFPEWPRHTSSKALDLESLCHFNFPEIKRMIDSLWINHICSEVGCKERFIVIDGNEKLYRFICSAEKKKVTGNKGEVNGYDMCIRNPIRGNQFKKSERLCEEHLNGSSGSTVEQLDIGPVTRSMTKSLPTVITMGE